MLNIRLVVIFTLVFSVFPVMSSDGCYKSDRNKNKLMSIFTANLSNDKLIDPDGTERLISAIKNASENKRYDLYEKSINKLSSAGNTSASLLTASILLESGDAKKCAEGYALLREIKNKTNNHNLANDLNRFILDGRNNALRVRESQKSIPHAVHVDVPSVVSSDAVSVDEKRPKSLMLIFED